MSKKHDTRAPNVIGKECQVSGKGVLGSDTLASGNPPPSIAVVKTMKTIAPLLAWKQKVTPPVPTKGVLIVTLL